MTRRALLLLALASCGYRPVHGRAQEKLHVALAETKVADAVATDEVLAGVREELARAGALAPGDGYPRCEVEVLRADESSEGIDVTRGQPSARATRIGIVARAWVARSGEGPPERDTGDVRSFETVSTALDAETAVFSRADALRAAGRRTGKRLAAHILGLPASSD